MTHRELVSPTSQNLPYTMPTRNPHRPFHLYSGHGYFLTGRTYQQKHYFGARPRKQIFIRVFSRLTKKFHIQIFSWSLLSNHYHILIALPLAQNNQTNESILPEFMSQLHGQVATILNKADAVKGRKVWYQYWDYCLRNEADFWKHFNYIVQQPLKHNLVRTLREAYDYPYSSNPVWQKRFGVVGLDESFVKYPVKDWTPVGEE